MFIGNIAWQAIGWAVPWAGPRTVIAGAALLLIALFGGWCYLKGASGREAAIAAERTAWTIAISKANQIALEKINAAERRAEEAAAAVAPAAAALDERVRQCARDPNCRAAR